MSAGFDERCRKELAEVLSHIRLDDMTAAEVVATLALLGPVEDRVRARVKAKEQPAAMVLSIVRPDESVQSARRQRS